MCNGTFGTSHVVWHIEHLHSGPVQVRISLLNSLKCSAFFISLGRLFHTRADSKRKEFLPYLVVLTVGISAMFIIPEIIIGRFKSDYISYIFR